MAVRQTDCGIDLLEVEKFLTSGWVFSLDSGQLAVGWGDGEWRDLPPLEATAVYAPDFYLTSTQPWRLTECFTLTTREQLRSRLIESAPNPVALARLKWEDPSLEEFREVFTKLQADFKSGLAQKAVPVVFDEAREDIVQERLRSALVAALSVPSPIRVFGVWTPLEGVLGVTPETLFQIRGKHLDTMALAGTRRGVLTEGEERAFLSDSKERHEHQLVIDDIQSRLAGIGSVRVSTTGIMQLPRLAHLFTPIEAELAFEIDFVEAAKRLHPTAALGVMPRSLGLDYMKTWDDPKARRRYGAPFGIQAREGDQWARECLVAIRSVQWQDVGGERRWRLGAGCGIVPQSVLENEWKELAAKRDSVSQLLGL